MSLDQLTILGNTVCERSKLESFAAPEGLTNVKLVSDEVTACCPITQQRDFYTVTILYTPSTLCLESKSLKLYLNSFANEGIFAEALTTRIQRDVVKAMQPRACHVEVVQKSRGGISIMAVAEYGK